MTTTEATDKQRLATMLLGQPVQDWIVEQRFAGLSWRLTARLLETETGVSVTHETIRQWSES